MMQWIGAVGCVGGLESRGLYYRVAPYKSLLFQVLH